MLQFSLFVIAGAFLCSVLPSLPAFHWQAGALLTSCLLAGQSRWRLLAAALLGFAGFGMTADHVIDQQLAAPLHRNKIIFNAQIIDFPKYKDHSIRLLVGSNDARLPARIRLAWYRTDAFPQLGEVWEFTGQLRRPRGSRNPGGFDYEGWLHRERVGASGYVISARRIEATASSGLLRWRLRAAQRLQALLPDGDARAALLAIAIGARQDISTDAWQRYAVTGTSHLMAISGLHVGLATAGAALLFWGIGGLLLPTGNIRDRALLAAVVVAALYAAVSGFAVPSQRAFLMTLLATAFLLLRRQADVFQLVATVALVVLVIDPLALLSPGYLLSFGAVTILLGVNCHQGAPTENGVVASARLWFGELGRLQAALLLGMLPLTALLFGRVAWLAPLANLLVLPLFSLITVPATLLGLVLSEPLAVAGDGLLWLAWCSLAAMHFVIDSLAAVPRAGMTLASPHGAALLLFLLPSLWVLVPVGFPGRQLAWLAFVAVVLYRPPGPPPGCAELHTLDVGQGLAVVVQTARHALLYDTGPSYRGGGSSGDRVILPFLASVGLRSLDTLIISHADQDHAGGAAALLESLNITKVLAGEPFATDHPHSPCLRGQQWIWDGVTFAVLHPVTTGSGGGNDRSCVLQMVVGESSVLLTGDIEGRVERELLRAAKVPKAALVQVPHHGSRTSSTPAFVDALSAEVALVSAGWENRWGFPKDDVVARWRSAGTQLLNTAESGAVSHRVCPGSGLTLLAEYRKQARRYWHAVDF